MTVEAVLSKLTGRGDEFGITVFGELKSKGEGGSSTSKGLAMEEGQFEFNSFLLQISMELTKIEFQHLKFVLMGVVPFAKCEEMTNVCYYFGELQKLLLLTPTNFGVLKEALTAVERPDLVAKLEEKEQYFAHLFRPQIKVGDNLEERGLFARFQEDISSAVCLSFVDSRTSLTSVLRRENFGFSRRRCPCILYVDVHRGGLTVVYIQYTGGVW